jgi:DNA-binding PadR family transcriptional regulator
MTSASFSLAKKNRARHSHYAGRNRLPASMPDSALDREILRPLWKVHILHHAREGPIVGHWMLEELREHGYRVSPGTLYPLLTRMVKLGWLERAERKRRQSPKQAQPYRATAAGHRALREVEARLRELVGEVHVAGQAAAPGHPRRKRNGESG